MSHLYIVCLFQELLVNLQCAKLLSYFSGQLSFFSSSWLSLQDNIITIFAFWKSRSLLKRTYYLLINPTIADVTVGIGVIKLMTSHISRLQTNEDTRWARHIAMDLFSGTASMTSLLLIAVERSLAIVSPFRHRVLTKRVYGYCIARVWITYALITMVTTMPELSEIRFWQEFLASFSPRLPSYI